MKTKRTYTMKARAEAVENTRTRIQAALFELAQARVFSDISLDDVAARSGVSVQTVLRHFGSRAELIEATTDYAVNQVGRERAAPTGDVAGALTVLLDHYELRGDAALLMLAQEQSEGQIARITETGRRMHRAWVEEVFAEHLPEPPGRSALVDLLVVATDVYAWKLLRRDRGLSRKQTQERMSALVDAVLTREHRA